MISEIASSDSEIAISEIASSDSEIASCDL